MSSVNYVNGVGLFTTKDGTKATLVYRLVVVTTPSGSDASGTAIFRSYTPVIGERLVVTNDHDETFECLISRIINGHYYIMVSGPIPEN
jgi:hypothetical protein